MENKNFILWSFLSFITIIFWLIPIVTAYSSYPDLGYIIILSSHVLGFYFYSSLKVIEPEKRFSKDEINIDLINKISYLFTLLVLNSVIHCICTIIKSLIKYFDIQLIILETLILQILVGAVLEYSYLLILILSYIIILRLFIYTVIQQGFELEVGLSLKDNINYLRVFSLLTIVILLLFTGNFIISRNYIVDSLLNPSVILLDYLSILGVQTYKAEEIIFRSDSAEFHRFMHLITSSFFISMYSYITIWLRSKMSLFERVHDHI